METARYQPMVVRRPTYTLDPRGLMLRLRSPQPATLRNWSDLRPCWPPHAGCKIAGPCQLLRSSPLFDRTGVEDVRWVSEYFCCTCPGKHLCGHLCYMPSEFDFVEACFRGLFLSSAPFLRLTDSAAWVLSLLRMSASLAVLFKATPSLGFNPVSIGPLDAYLSNALLHRTAVTLASEAIDVTTQFCIACFGSMEHATSS